MSVLDFEKWEGLGNDFILVQEEVAPARVRELCDRHTGIGGDGVLQVERLAPRKWKMIVLNADGSRPEMCGNGLRCVAGYACEREQLHDGELTVVTDAGERWCEPRRESAGRYRVRVSMGTAKLGGRSAIHPRRKRRRAAFGWSRSAILTR